MTTYRQVSRHFRNLRAAVLGLGLVVGFCASAVAAPAPSAYVVTIASAGAADLVLLDGGFGAGLREGMVCRVTRGTTEIAEVLLVELRPTCSAALILSLSPKQAIRAGDIASIKVLKS